MDPHRKDNPRPHIRKCPYGDGMAFPLCSCPLIVVFGPRFTLGSLPGKLMQGVAQRFDAAQPAMSFGIDPTLIEGGGGSYKCLQNTCILIPLTIIPNLSQQSWSQTLPSTRQTLKDLMVLMSQKKGVNLLVILCNLFNEWQQLAHQDQHQARFGAGEPRISLQVGMVQPLDDRSRAIGWTRMLGWFAVLLYPLARSRHPTLCSWA